MASTGPALRAHEESVGSMEVRQALASFEEHWAHGRDKLATAAEDLAMMLRESVAAFEAVDSAVGRAATAAGSRMEKGGT
jgi:hypothetical protein